MKKKLVILLILICCMLPFLLSLTDGDAILMQGDTGSEVYAIQRRLCELGYLNYRPTGKFSDMTTNAVFKFQQVNGIGADGQVGRSTSQALFSHDAKRNMANPQFKKRVGVGYTGEVNTKGVLSGWEVISQAYPVGSTATVRDYNTGKTFRMTRVGGNGCAQVKTETADDFDVYTEVFNGETWEHRTVLVSIGGTEYAASLFGMPTNHEVQAATDAAQTNMNGYTILYFNNSHTDVQGLADEEHTLAVLRTGS
jgi:peptidoglycan hydrolase-like protein with peptidoglycan-binding domain